MAVPKKKSSKTRTNRRYRTWVSKEQKRLSEQLVLVPYGRGAELKPAHTYIDDGEDLRKRKNAKAPTTPATTKPAAKTASKKTASKKPATKKSSEDSPASEA